MDFSLQFEKKLKTVRFFTTVQRAQIIALLEEGVNQIHVAKRMGVHRSSISRVWARYQETGRFRRRRGQSRRRVTSAREDRLIVNEAIRKPLMIARQIANDVLPHRRISDQTIRNRQGKRLKFAGSCSSANVVCCSSTCWR